MKRSKPEVALFISYRYPPDGGVGCLRNHEAVLHNALYRKSIVLTPRRGLYRDKQYDNSRKEEVRLIENTDLKSGINSSWRKVLSSSLFQSAVRSMSSWMEMRPWLSSWLSVGGKGYKSRCLDEFALVDEKYHVKYLYCSYQPLQDIEVASTIKAMKPDVFWICDFRDYPRSYARLTSHRQEYMTRLCAAADYVTFSTVGLSKYYAFIAGDRQSVLYSGSWHSTRHRPALTTPAESGTKFIMCYAGSLYGPRALDFYLRVINRLIVDDPSTRTRIVLRYLGIDAGIWNAAVQRAGLSDISESSDILPYVESLECIRASDLLLYLDWSDDDISGILGYKIWDYFAAGLPILSISRGNISDELASLLSYHDFQCTDREKNIDACVTYVRDKIKNPVKGIERSALDVAHERATTFWRKPESF